MSRQEESVSAGLRVEEKIEKWQQWIQTIEEDVRGLLIQAHIFHEIQDIIRANPALDQPSSFYSWMGAVHASSCAVGVRRQADKRRDVICLTRLLKEIEADDHLLHREWFLSLYTDPKVREQIADSHFDSLAGEGATYYEASRAGKDRERLQSTATTIRQYVNKRVAHRGEDDPKEIPTFKDLDEAIVVLEDLVVKYNSLLRATPYPDDLLPTWQYDWKAIFQVPWITDGDLVSE
ncbi:hypothetical protein BH18GEM1_BH18GEM1_08150 [soil metagenome]